MTSTAPSLFQNTYHYMRWLAARQKIIAQNLSHVDTPHYHAQDLVPFRSQVKSSSLAPVRTHHAHRMEATMASEFVLRKDSAPEVRLSENAVSVEHELAKASEVAHAHALMTNQYKKTMSLFRLAMGRRAGG